MLLGVLAGVLLAGLPLWAEIASFDSGTLAPVESGLPPGVGTFWLLKGPFGGSQIASPPLPFVPPHLASSQIYDLGEGQYLIDDRAVDYLALEEQRQMEQALKSLETGMNLLGAPPMPGEGELGSGEGDSGSGGPPLFTQGLGLCLMPPLFAAANTVILTVTNVIPGWETNHYDVYWTTNLGLATAPELSATHWCWLGGTVSGETQISISGLTHPEGYFRLGTALDTDNDGLPDAYENLSSHTHPGVFNLAFTTGTGVPDAWYLQYRIGPMGSALASADSDADGLNNQQEYRSGNNPNLAQPWSVWVGSPASDGKKY
jgi:hypothetical protein